MSACLGLDRGPGARGLCSPVAGRVDMAGDSVRAGQWLGIARDGVVAGRAAGGSPRKVRAAATAFEGRDHRCGGGMMRPTRTSDDPPIASLMPGLPGGNAGGGGQRDAKTLPPPFAHGRAAAFRVAAQPGRVMVSPGVAVAPRAGAVGDRAAGAVVGAVQHPALTVQLHRLRPAPMPAVRDRRDIPRHAAAVPDIRIAGFPGPLAPFSCADTDRSEHCAPSRAAGWTDGCHPAP